MTLRAIIVPTARALTLAALAAPLALLTAMAAPGAWVIGPTAVAAFVLVIVADGLVAGTVRDVRLIAPADTEVGEPLALTVLAEISGRANGAPQVSLALDPRLAGGGRAEFDLSWDEADGLWRGTSQTRPARRGTGQVTRLWLRWRGPLGLAYRQYSQPVEQDIRVWPNLSPIRSPALQAFLRDASFGLIARRLRGDGSQFESLAEYQPGMDRRRIDWKSSARHAALYARENESERNNPIVFAFDCGQAMSEPLDGLPRIDRAVTAALTAAWVALKGGDRVALFGFARQPEMMTPFVSETRGFHHLQTAAAALDYHAVEPNFTLALATLTARLRRRSLVVLFSDFNDPTGAELMLESVGRLVRHHLVMFVTLEDAELAQLVGQDPADIEVLGEAVAADTLVRQRALVLQRLRRQGVDVIEAPYDRIGYDLIDRYLAIKRSGAIG